MKLYATINSERDSRPAKKGGDKYLEIWVTCKERPAYEVIIDEADSEMGSAITIYAGGTEIFSNRE